MLLVGVWRVTAQIGPGRRSLLSRGFSWSDDDVICDAVGNQQDEERERGKEDRFQLIVEKRRMVKQRRLYFVELVVGRR